MGLFDFLKAKKENKWAKEKEKVAQVAPVKRDLGVCVPNHAKSAEEKKKLKGKREINPFDKLRAAHLKETSEFNKEFTEISQQESEEPYEYAPELGVEGIEEKKRGVEEKKSEAEITYDANDELDVAAEKMSKGYVPRFSSTARQKLGLEEKPVQQNSISGTLEVSGVYVGAETMISGRVISGRLKKSMSAQRGKGTIRISDLKQSSRTVSELVSGEEGTVFVRGNANNLRNGDTIDFS